jgi:hypothetical protein
MVEKLLVGQGYVGVLTLERLVASLVAEVFVKPRVGYVYLGHVLRITENLIALVDPVLVQMRAKPVAPPPKTLRPPRSGPSTIPSSRKSLAQPLG